MEVSGRKPVRGADERSQGCDGDVLKVAIIDDCQDRQRKRHSPRTPRHRLRQRLFRALPAERDRRLGSRCSAGKHLHPMAGRLRRIDRADLQRDAEPAFDDYVDCRGRSRSRLRQLVRSMQWQRRHLRGSHGMSEKRDGDVHRRSDDEPRRQQRRRGRRREHRLEDARGAGSTDTDALQPSTRGQLA